MTETMNDNDFSKRTLANRQNALKSTGPKSEDGKKRVSMNAFKHGLSGQKLLLQADEYVPYFELASEYIAEYAPVGVREEQLAQHIIDSNWRLNRCAAMENNLLGAGTVQHDQGALHAEDDDTVAMIGQSLAWRDGSKAFEALSRHEGRIWRFMQKMEEKLERLQEKRLRLNNGQTTFVREASRAWRFYIDSLAHHLSLRDRQRVETEAEAEAEAASSLQTEETTTTSAMALNCESPAISPDQAAFTTADIRNYVADSLPAGLQSELQAVLEGRS